MKRAVSMATAVVATTMMFGMAQAQDMGSASEGFRLAHGAQLYDKFWKLTKTEAPSETHAAYPADAHYKGDSTWRCKECHGWDYKGADGAYSSGKHATGITGIAGAAGKDPAEIAGILRGETHGYTAEMIPDDAMADLALFVSKGQIDPTPFVADGKSSGDVESGKAYYETVCAGCHGLDGKKIKDADPLGAVSGNTVEMMHKVLNGQPGEAMPAMRQFDTQIAADIVAYIQTLPE